MAPASDKREAILEAMLDLIVERGFHNAPMSLLAKRAGASAGVIYHYFPSKEELIHALYRRVKATKHQALFAGYSADATPQQIFLRLWINTYHFYRNHRREARFLDQYENSPFCEPPAAGASAARDPDTAHVLKLFRTRKSGGVLKDLPMEALYEFTFGTVSRLAKQPQPLKPATLRKVADASWQAIAAK